ncbi:MAG: sarcosine oxidase subunit gamma [Paracoccaceae bacterium]
MVNLVAVSGIGEQLPLEIGSCKLVELQVPEITSIALGKGQQKAVSADLKKSYGLAFPAANRVTQKNGVRCTWTGPGQAFLVGTSAKILKGAALTDQSDGWVVMRLQGMDAEAVLARLIPLDLRALVFKNNHTARTLLNHVSVSISRNDEFTFELMVFRSMATTAISEISQAMKSIASRRR